MCFAVCSSGETFSRALMSCKDVLWGSFAARFVDADLGDLDLVTRLFGIVLEVCEQIDPFTEQGLGGHAAFILIGDKRDGPIGFDNPTVHDTLEVVVRFDGGLQDVVEDRCAAFQFTLALMIIPGGSARPPVILPGLSIPGARRSDSARCRYLWEVVPISDEDTIAAVEAAGGAQVAVGEKAPVPAVGFAGKRVVGFGMDVL